MGHTQKRRPALVTLCWSLMPGACGFCLCLGGRQNYSFYDLIVTKARGKSGPLFHFDVHDDVRVIHDVRVEKDEVSMAWQGPT